jgi:hypothetical protein
MQKQATTGGEYRRVLLEINGVGQFTELSVTLINHYDVNKSKLEK